MTDSKSVLTVIPAKARSSRVPGKNIKKLCGKPLLQYAVEQAVESGVCGTVCVSTDNEDIAELARTLGAEVPFLRDPSYSEDHISAGAVALEMLSRFESELGRTFDDLCMLLTTCPLRSAEDIVESRRLYLDHPEADAVLSMTESSYPPAWMKTLDEDGLLVPFLPHMMALDRPELPGTLVCNGAVYWVGVKFFMEVDGDDDTGKIVPYMMPPERSVDIDTPFDWMIAELLLADG